MFGVLTSHVVPDPCRAYVSRAVPIRGGASFSPRCIPFAKVAAFPLEHGSLAGLHDGDALVLHRVETLPCTFSSTITEVAVRISIEDVLIHCDVRLLQQMAKLHHIRVYSKASG